MVANKAEPVPDAHVGGHRFRQVSQGSVQWLHQSAIHRGLAHITAEQLLQCGIETREVHLGIHRFHLQQMGIAKRFHKPLFTNRMHETEQIVAHAASASMAASASAAG